MLLRDDFIGSMSHDLRSPLATVKGRAQVLQRRLKRWDDPRQAEPIAQGLAKTEHAAPRMAARLDDLADLARLQAGHPHEIRVTASAAAVRR
jgi:signal transduction histidine kinase